MQIRTAAFLFVASSCLLFSITSSAAVSFTSRAPCHTVLQYVGSTYFLNVGEQLRGADEDILLLFFNKSIEVMLDVLEKDYDSRIMSDVCLRNEDLRRIKREVSSISLTVSTEDMAVSNRLETAFTQLYYSANQSTIDFVSGMSNISSSTFVDDQANVFDLTVGDSQSFTVFPRRENRFDRESLKNSYAVMGVGSAASNLRHLRTYRKFLGNIFYIPKEDVSDEALTTYNEELVNQIWGEIEDVLRSYEPHSTLKPFIARLPRTVEIFFDPLETEVKARFKKHTRRALFVNGFDLLCNVTVNVLKLRSANLPESISLRPLRHVASHLFNAMRVYKVDGDKVSVPNIYVPFYDGFYATAVRGCTVPDWANGITAEIVQSVYGKDLLALLDFSNHGLLTYNVLRRSGAYVEVDFVAKLFDRRKLALLKTLIDRQKTMAKAMEAQRVGYPFSEISSSARLHGWMESLLNVQFPWFPTLSQSAARPTTICADQFIYYEPTTDDSWVNLDQHYCCARICLDIDYINAPGISSIDQCCSFCNGAACPTHEGTPIASILSVMISDYGWLDGEIATIVL